MIPAYKTFFLSWLLVSFCAGGMAQSLKISGGKEGLSIFFGGKERLNGGKVLSQNCSATLTINKKIEQDVALFSLSGNAISITESSLAGLFFNNIPHYRQGLTIWRYKPWNSWTKPVAIANANEMEAWDVSF